MLTRIFIGAGKRPFLDWNYQSIFPIEFMLTAKLLFSSCVSTFFWFTNFFLLFNLVSFFKNRTCLCYFLLLFLFFFFFFYIIHIYTKQLGKDVRYESATVFSCYTTSLSFVFNILNSVSSPSLIYRKVEIFEKF